jgi:L,D-transpeptidase YcbB
METMLITYRKIRLWVVRAFIVSFLIVLASCKSEEKNKDLQSTYSPTPSSSQITPKPSATEIQNILGSRNNLPLFNKDTVQAFYRNNNYQPIWHEELRNSLITTLKKAEYEGLYYKDYHGQELDFILNKENPRTTQLVKLDLFLTDAYFKFGEHLLNGKVNPREIHEIWDVPRNKADLFGLLAEVIETNNLEIALKELRPQNPIYNGLIASSKEYKNLLKTTSYFEPIEEGKMIIPGEKDPRLNKIQLRLIDLGYLKHKDTTLIYTESLQEAVKRYQSDFGLEVDGIIGNGSIAELNKTIEDRHQQIMVNLERWRWFPRNMGSHYILLNIANFHLTVMKNNKQIREHKVIVGMPSRKTPLFSETIEYLIFNPSWIIPPTIKKKDVIPGTRKNVAYLERKKINVYKNGNLVDPNSIDWNSSEVYSYRYKQNPGSTNPLGVVKMIYPNKYIIYLHDTPSKPLFKGNLRSHSSGCVRVENAIDLAKYLLSDQEKYSSTVIDSILSKNETKRIEMKQKVDIHHLYWTSWRENGKTRFNSDVYNYDEKTYKALLKVS